MKKKLSKYIYEFDPGYIGRFTWMTHGRRENAAMPVRSTSSSCVHIGTIRSQVSGLTVAIMSRHPIVGCACPRERQHFHPSQNFAFFQIFHSLAHPTDHLLLSSRKWRFQHHSSFPLFFERKLVKKKKNIIMVQNSVRKSLSLLFYFITNV